VAREVGDKPFTSWALLCLGGVAQLQGRLELARSCFKEALRISGDVGYERHIAACVASLGVLAAQQGAYARCAHLIGAAITLHGGLRSSLDIDENEAWDEGLAAARDALGESGFAAAWAEGESTFLNASKAEGLALGSGRRAEALSLRRSAIDRIIEYAQGT
jgi:hypothetical protein